MTKLGIAVSNPTATALTRATAWRTVAITVCTVTWILALGYLAHGFIHEAYTPGAAGLNVQHWPAASGIQRDTNRATLVMSAHPQCPCTDASIYELAQILTRCQGKVSAKVLFIKPASFPDSWAKTKRWVEVNTIPGAEAILDVDGVESAGFGAKTSGDVAVFDANGRLLFRGGITESRGHAGDNPGADAVIAAIESNTRACFETSVFGCPLSGK